QYHILGVCLGKKTGDWSDFLFVRTIDLERHTKHSLKLAVFHRVPLPDADNLLPWYSDLGELIAHYNDPPCPPKPKINSKPKSKTKRSPNRPSKRSTRPN